MSGKEGTGLPQQRCQNCGAQIRPGDTFCASCGERLATSTGSSPHEQATTKVPASSGYTTQDTYEGVVRWVKNLPLPLWIAIGLGVLGLLVLLGLKDILIFIVFAASIIFILVRLLPRRTLERRLSVRFLASLMLIIVLALLFIAALVNLFGDQSTNPKDNADPKDKISHAHYRRGSRWER